MWHSPVPEKRWRGFRRELSGTAAFESLSNFERASVNELENGLAEHELATLGRLLARGNKVEIEVFVRTHGPNPIFDPQGDLNIAIGAAKADVVSLDDSATAEANRAVLDGEVLHIFFQAGEASRFSEGPFYQLVPTKIAEHSPGDKGLDFFLKSIALARAELKKETGGFIVETPLGPKQPVLLRAALRRVVQDEIEAGRLTAKEAMPRYRAALANQKLLFFVSARGGVNQAHDERVREKHAFYGFDPMNLVTIEQELARGISADETGKCFLLEGDGTMDAAGHMYALMQASRPGDFTTYTESGRPIKPMEIDAFSYFLSRGAKVLSVIRINDMDRHSTEIINAKALAHAQKLFQAGYVNAIETVSNPDGQKGGTGTTFGDPEIHVLTETHENSFPSLARAFEAGVQTYLKENKGRHPAYNAMRQWADLAATRHALKEFGGRIVYVPRQKETEGKEISYLGVDMPMGDMSLLYSNYKSRMFQFAGSGGRELLIHDMKQKEHLGIALRTILRQLEDPHVITAAQELISGELIPFTANPGPRRPYGAPCPEFDN